MTDERARRAAKLSRVPGVTIAEAAERFGASVPAVRRARQDVTALTLDELLLAALTREGRETSGTLGDLDGLARWLDHLNHDGATAAEVRSRLDALAKAGALIIDRERWRLARPWP